MTKEKTIRIERMDEDIRIVEETQDYTSNKGRNLILREYLHTQRNINGETIIVGSMFFNPTKEELEEALAYLRENGQKEIIITDRSTALMETLLNLINNGCSVAGPATVTHKEKWGEIEIEEGLRIRI